MNWGGVVGHLTSLRPPPLCQLTAKGERRAPAPCPHRLRMSTARSGLTHYPTQSRELGARRARRHDGAPAPRLGYGDRSPARPASHLHAGERPLPPASAFAAAHDGPRPHMIANSAAPGGGAPRPLDAVTRLGDVLGTPAPQIESRTFAAASGRTSFRWVANMMLVRFMRQRSLAAREALFREALYNPEVARELAAMTMVGRVPAARARRLTWARQHSRVAPLPRERPDWRISQGCRVGRARTHGRDVPLLLAPRSGRRRGRVRDRSGSCLAARRPASLGRRPRRRRNHRLDGAGSQRRPRRG